ncbi:hypothetical protein CoNPh17_CDS0147 [Staphylococcus phage S-CoN_Ph17]|nr:hypothetical protein CoNPh17_CDS0147 [Staphylococcus phage S-CoN_Ph17]
MDQILPTHFFNDNIIIIKNFRFKNINIFSITTTNFIQMEMQLFLNRISINDYN